MVKRGEIDISKNWLKSLGIALFIWLVPTIGLENAAVAAERIYVSYAILERSISIAALEEYAKTGKLDDDLAVYTQYLSEQQLIQLQRVLVTPVELSAVAVSQFLYTPQGIVLLQRLGEVIKTESRQTGFYALRAALILAAADPEGLTLLNILHRFPTRSIRIDLRRSLQIAEELEKLVNQTRQAIAFVSEQSTIAALKQVNFSQLPDIRQRGRFAWQKQTLQLNDARRSRTFLADLYLPISAEILPLIVISHGLGSDRNSFEYLAIQLASYGFAVAVPQHPGSDAEQLRSLLSGRDNLVIEPNEFINRPLDMQYLLDQLEILDKSDPSFQLNMQQVGAIGQSFGGYTVLALAGAELNFSQLQKDCQDGLNNSWNVSLLLQCRLLQLPITNYKLHDKRITAAIAINPITSSIFSEAGFNQIKIPVMLVASSADTFAPALAEQIIPFTWLNTPDKYLVAIANGTHFSTIGETNPSTDPLAIPSQVIGANPAIARRYINVLSVAFCQTYIAELPQYRPYLSAAYVQSISQSPLDLSFVQSLPTELLEQAISPK